MELITLWKLLAHVLLVRLFLGVSHGSVVSLLADDRCPVLLFSYRSDTDEVCRLSWFSGVVHAAERGWAS